MADNHGEYIWYELMTSDPDAAQEFYGPMLGWDFADSGMDGMDYRMFSKDGTNVGGLMPLSEEMTAGGARPLWAGYLSVDDADVATKDIAAAGGTVMMEPADIPGVGRFAFVADPQGAPIYIMKPEPAEGSSESFAKYEPREGHCAWNELVTTDPDGAKSFYGKIFGWDKRDEMDMGEMGLYEMLGVGDYVLGAVMRKPAEMPVSMWVYYFRVPDIDRAAEYTTANGGQVINGPMEVPGGEHIIQGMDPQGAMFALIGKRTES